VHHRVLPRRRERGEPVGEPVEVGKSVSALAVGQNGVWALLEDERAVVRIDPASGKPTGVTVTLPDFADDIAAGAGAVWATVDGKSGLMRFDPGTGEPVARINGTGNSARVATGDFSEVALTAEGRVVFVDPDSNRVLRRVRVGATADGLAWDITGDVWAADPDGGRVVEVPFDGEPVVFELGGSPSEVAFASGFIWVLDPDNGVLHRIDVESEEVASPSIEVGGQPMSLAATDGAVWVGFEDGRVQRYDGP
jgi:DNA-binding beta-propeller fold protein YncE